DSPLDEAGSGARARSGRRARRARPGRCRTSGPRPARRRGRERPRPDSRWSRSGRALRLRSSSAEPYALRTREKHGFRKGSVNRWSGHFKGFPRPRAYSCGWPVVASRIPLVPSVSVVTPWQSHAELAPAYFTALEHGRPDEVIVVDDASEPALRFASLCLESRQGFQRACNRGLRAAKSDAVLFLNNDVR